MQLSQRDPNGRVPVRRLWPGSPREKRTITGAVSSDRAPLFASIVIAAPLTPELAVAA